MSGLVGDSDATDAAAAAAADSSSFLLSVGLGASLINVDCRTSVGFSGSAFCFLAAEPTLDADSLLGMPGPPLVLLSAGLCLGCLEADDEDDALPGEAVRGSCDNFPPF